MSEHNTIEEEQKPDIKVNISSKDKETIITCLIIGFILAIGTLCYFAISVSNKYNDLVLKYNNLSEECHEETDFYKQGDLDFEPIIIPEVENNEYNEIR